MGSVRFGLVGVGGYAKAYVSALDILKDRGVAHTSVAVIRNPAKYPNEMEKFTKEGVTIVPSVDAMYEAADAIDMVAIPTGIPTHAPLTVQAHGHGYNIMLEKPPAATIQDVDRMLEAGRQAGRFCAVGFQALTMPTIRGLKQRIVDGQFGELKLLANKGHWKRLDSYYERNAWAGLLKVDGQWTLDGPAINALAHQLNNMLYLAGPTMHESAEPATVRAELNRAHHVEGEDASCIEVVTTTGVRILFYVTYCSERNTAPEMDVEGEKATAHWSMGGPASVQYADGRAEEFDDSSLPRPELIAEMFHNAVRVHHGEQEHLNCSLEMTRPFVKVINGAYYSNGWPRPIPTEYVTRVEENDSVATYVADLDETMDRAFAERKLYSDVGAPWSAPTEPFDVTGLTCFDETQIQGEYPGS